MSRFTSTIRRTARTLANHQLQRWLQRFACSWLVLAGCCATALGQPADNRGAVAYFAQSIYLGDGPAVHDGVLLVKDGKVVAVGPRGEVELPADVQRVELGMQTIVPGFVIAQSSLTESQQTSDYAISPEVQAVDGFDPFADYSQWLSAGVTTVQLAPGGQRLISGQGAVVKLAGEQPDQLVLRATESLSVNLTSDALSPPTIYEPPVGAVSVERPVEPTRPQLATSLAQAIVGLQALFETAAAGESEGLTMEAMHELLMSKLSVRFTARNAAEIQAARKLAEQFELNWILVGPEDLDALKQINWEEDRLGGVVLTPDFRPGRLTNPSVPVPGRKPTAQLWQLARTLVDQGAEAKIALRPATDADLRDIMFLAASLRRGGLSVEQVLRTVTSNAADLLGVEERVGSLNAGRDADFVVLSGAPFVTGTKVVETYVDGKRVFAAEADASSVVIDARQVLTRDGFVSGGVSVRNGKIVAVGDGVSIPGNATVKRYESGVIVPGWIDCGTTLGLGSSLADALSLDAKIGEWLARDDEQIAVARQGGVTTAFLSSTRLPSPVLAFKLSDQPRPVMDPVAIRFEISGNLTSAEESTRQVLSRGKAYSDTWKKYEADFAEYQQKLKLYEIEKAKYDAAVKAAEEKKKADEAKKAEAKKTEEAKKPAEGQASGEAGSGTNDEKKTPDSKPGSGESASDKPADAAASAAASKDASKPAEPATELKEPTKPEEPKKPNVVAAMEPYRDLFADKLAAMVELSDPRAVEIAIKLFREEYKIRTAFVATSATLNQGELLAKHDVLVVSGPTLIEIDEGEEINYPADLAVAGVPIAFQSSAGTGTGNLPDVVAFSVYKGLGQAAAIAAMSHRTAEFFKLPGVGELAAGRDADLVVLSGPPFDIATEVLAVMIDGKWVYEKEQD